MKDSHFSIPDNVNDLEALAISIIDGDVPLPEEPSQLLLEHIKKYELIKRSIGDVNLPSSSTQNAQIQIAISAATDEVVVPLKRNRFFNSKTTGAIAASIALLLLISGALITTRSSSETDTEYLAAITTDSSTTSSEASEKVVPLQSHSGEITEESAESLFDQVESGDIDGSDIVSDATVQPFVDGVDQQEIDLSAYEEQAIELFLEILVPESILLSTLIEDLPCSEEFVQNMLNEPIIYSLWISDTDDIESQVIAIFGTENLLLINSMNCDNNLLVEGILS